MQYLKIKKLESIWNNTCQFNYWLLSLFFSLGLLGILRHAMWRDELNGWLISRDSSFPGEFLQNIRYEGHPVLWYICLYYLNQLTANPGAMQLLHLLIATASIYLFLHFSPFNKVQKSLFCFGYLPFYEYLLISRNYAIGLLSIFAFCTLFEGRKKGYIYLAIALAFMANSNAYCLCISVAFCLTLVLEYAFKHWLEIPLNASLKNRL